jgi:hypothetical protein
MDISTSSSPETSGPQSYTLEEVKRQLRLRKHVKTLNEEELCLCI